VTFKIKPSKASLVIFIALLPIMLVIIAEQISSVLSCTVTERLPSDCIIFGVDIGMILAVSYSAGWAALVTIPAALIFTLFRYFKKTRQIKTE
jgi:hypothetical protein